MLTLKLAAKKTRVVAYNVDCKHQVRPGPANKGSLNRWQYVDFVCLVRCYTHFCCFFPIVCGQNAVLNHFKVICLSSEPLYFGICVLKYSVKDMQRLTFL